MCRERARRHGHSLIEVVVALLILALVGSAAAASLMTLARLGGRVAERSEWLAARRSLAAVTGWETRAIAPSRDGLVVAGDSIAFRVFRGQGVVCSVNPAPVIRYRGLRAPDAGKDSLLVVSGATESAMMAASFAAVPVSPCALAAGERAWAVPSTTTLRAGDIVLVFERGAYHLSAHALRYRRGAGGRQPVTADVFHDDSTRFRLVMAVRPGSGTEPAAIRVRAAFRLPASGSADGPALDFRLPLRNMTLSLDSLAP